MRKNIVKIFLVAVFFILFSLPVFAQTVTPTPTPPNITGQGWGNFCIPAVQCSDANSGCNNLTDAVHRAALKIESANANYVSNNNIQVYIVECVYTDKNPTPTCTTGDKNTDATAGLPPVTAGSYDAIGFKLAPKLALLSNPEVAISNPVDPSLMSQTLTWHDNSTTYKHMFFAYYHPPVQKPSPPPGQGGQQQGEMQIDWSSALQVCKPITWDPSGRVFDSQTLEPVNGVNVNLLRKQTDGTYKMVSPADIGVTGGGTFTNPYTTVDNGSFSFFVADGTYHLTLSSPYTFPSVKSLNPNYSQMYFDIYPGSTGDMDIVEQGGPQHRDIPIDSTTPIVTPLKLIDIVYQGDHVGNVYLDGRVSHPLSIISVYTTIPGSTAGQRIRYRLIDTVTADKFGEFSLKESQSNFDPNKGEGFGEIEIAKSPIFAYDNSKATIVQTFDPMPTYLQGTAYNQSGATLPDATVGIYMNSSSNPYYQTKTDSKGYFEIPTDYIPTLPYTIKYTTKTGGSVTVTTSQFVESNAKYISDNKIDLYKPNFSDPKVNSNLEKSLANLTKNVGTSSPFGKNYGTGVGTNPTTAGTSGQGTSFNIPNSTTNSSLMSPKNLTIIGFVILIAVMLVAAVLLGIYLARRNQNPEN